MKSKTTSNGKSRTIKVDYLARVEGEGGLFIKVRNGHVQDVKLRIFEPPRFFEAFLRGRKFTEAPDITARICGICPIAYQMSSTHAMEQICGVKVGGMLRELRRLIYCGEWIESHALHVYMLHAPDFLGYQDAIQMAKDHADVVKQGLRMKKIGNYIMTLIGGREIHPINVRVGGFYKVPTKRELTDMMEDLKWGRDAALKTVELVKTFEMPDFDQDYEFVALKHPDEYPLNEGRLISNKGIDTEISGYDEVLIEEHVEHSTSLHSHVSGRGPCCVGPMARYNLNYDQLHPIVHEAARRAGVEGKCTNPFKSIIIRSLEMVYAFEEAIRIVEAYEQPEKASVDMTPRSGTGYGCTEAPRGICYQRYTIDDEGVIQDVKIVAPTSVNQKVIEKDLRNFVEPKIDLPHDTLQWQCEQAVRNYDPCISCSCHFLKLDLDRK